MLKKGVVAALVVAVLIGAGAGVYFLYSAPEEDSTLSVKGSFEVGNRHTTIEKYRTTIEVTGIKEGNEFAVMNNGEPEDISHGEMGYYKEWLIESSGVVDDEHKTGNERIMTVFGERDCTVYFKDFGWITVTYYIGEHNGAAYRAERVYGVAKEVHVIEAADMYIESNDTFELKNPQDIKVGDKFISYSETEKNYEIAEIRPAEGNNPETYRIKTDDDPEYLTREELLDTLGIYVSDYVIDTYERKGTVSVDTPLGKVKCDNYADDEDLGLGSFVYVSNGIYVKSGSDFHQHYWTYSDFIKI